MNSLINMNNNKYPPEDNQKIFPWDFYSTIIIAMFSLTQIFRWMILPRSMDIYYHLLTAWGFIQSGGYSGWDFWEYAPVGRMHIYPPVFHIVLAFLIKLGMNKIILAKILRRPCRFCFLSLSGILSEEIIILAWPFLSWSPLALLIIFIFH